MANGGHIAKDTLFGPTTHRGRAIDWDLTDRFGISLRPIAFDASLIKARSNATIQTPYTWPHPTKRQI